MREANEVNGVVITLSGSATHCLDCNGVEFMHRMGCRCIDMSKPNALSRINIEHGFFKKVDGITLSVDDFVSNKTIVNHVKNGTATVYIDGKLVTKDMIE